MKTLFTILFLFCTTATLLAQTNDVVYTRWEPCSCPDWFANAYIAPEVFYRNGKISQHEHAIADFFGLPQSKKLHGVFYGVNGGYIYKSTWGLYAQIDADYAVGKLKNRHSTNRLDHDFYAEGLLGYNCSICDFNITPYIGIGYWYQRQKFEEKTFFDDDLELRYQIYYVPVGIKMSYLYTPYWELGLHFKATPQADSTLKVTSFKGVRWELAKTTGYFVEVPITYNAYCRDYVWKFVIIPFWRMTTYGKSEKKHKSSFVLLSSPEQIYNDWGARLEAGTCF